MSTPLQPLPCDGDACCSPGIATTGLCLAEGTPIAVLAVSACSDCGGAAAAPSVTGWLNLLTGAFTVGNPPAGTVPCTADVQQFTVSQWCDLDAEGEVIAPVLIQYQRDEQGAIIGISTLTPAGQPYVVVGTLGLCPGPTGDVEYVVLCDVAGDGTATPFLRALTPNGDGTSTSDDTTLDGATPYVVAGTVTACGARGNPGIDSTIERVTGAGSVAVTVGARSVTVTVLAGSPTVAISAGTAVELAPGSWTWGVDRGGAVGEQLLDAFEVEGLSGDDFTVHTTREP